jgi:hypothetical protein
MPGLLCSTEIDGGRAGLTEGGLRGGEETRKMDRRREAAPLGTFDARACSWASTWTETRATSAGAELQQRRPSG